MSITTNSPFGARSQRGAGSRPFGQTESATGAVDRPKAEYWLNIGYMSSAPGEDGEPDRDVFISLSTGIPLDQAEIYDVAKARSSNMAALRQAQNELHEGFMSRAKALEPGESAIISYDETTGLSMEIKRVRGEQAIPVENTLKRSFSFR